MGSPLKEIKRGDAITADWLNAIVRRLREIAPQPSGDILPNTQPGGTSYQLRRLDRNKATKGLHPFQIYQHNGSGGSGGLASDWRTFWTHKGFLNTSEPDNDDAAATPLEIVVPEASMDYPVILQAVRDESGNITNLTLLAPDSDDDDDIWAKWVDYEQHNYPSNVLNYTIGKIDAGNDSTTYDPPESDPDYHSLEINQLVESNIVEIQKLTPWLPGTLYQFIYDPSAPASPDDWRTIAVSDVTINGTLPDNISDSFLCAASTTTHFWIEVTLDSGWAVSTVHINHGDGSSGSSGSGGSGGVPPSNPELTDCDTPPGDPWIISLGSVETSDDTARTLTFSQTNDSNHTLGSEKKLGEVFWESPKLRQRFTRVVILDGTPIAQTSGSGSGGSGGSGGTCEADIVEFEAC